MLYLIGILLIMKMEMVSSVGGSGVFKNTIIQARLGRNNLVYCATGRGMEIIDITDYKNPIHIGWYASSGEGEAVCVSGNYAYLADGSQGLKIIDIFNPKQPVEKKCLKLDGYALDVVSSGGYIYVASCDSGINIISSKNSVKRCLEGSVIRDIEIQGKYLYAVDYKKGLQIFDISRPKNPGEVGKFKVSGMSMKVSISDSIAFLLSDRGLNIINIVDPKRPFLISTIAEKGNDIAIYGKRAYLVAEEELKIINLENIINPCVVGKMSMVEGRSVGGQSIAIGNSIAYVSCLRYGLVFLDISDSVKPIIVGRYDPAGQVYDVKVDGDRLYTANYQDGIEIIDLKDIKKPTVIGKYDTKGAAWAICKEKFYICVADDVGGVWTVNVKNPYKPENLGYLDTHYTEPVRGYARGVCIKDNYAYIADHVGGLLILDMSDPSKIAKAGRFQTPQPVWDVGISGNYCYLAEGENGVRVIDVSNVSEPKEIKHFDTDGFSWALDISENYCYVADGNDGLRIMDLMQGEIGYFNTEGCASGVKVVLPYAYVADGNSGVVVLNVSKPNKPEEVDHYDTPGYARRIAVSYPFIFVADSYGGLIILNMGNKLVN